MGPVQASVENPVKVAVGVLLLVLFGTLALLRMPMQLTPEVQTPTISIETRWPGASPQEVEREIVQEQEEQLKSVEGVEKLSSESRDSQGTVSLEFAVGTDMNEALLLVNSRLQQVQDYPEDAQEPVISTTSSSANPIAWFILGPRVPTPDEIDAFMEGHPELADELRPVRDTKSLPLRLQRVRSVAAEHPAAAELLPPEIDVPKQRRLAEDVIEARFERVGGVANANVVGGREEELRVVVDPARLAARGLTVGDLRRALRGRNQDTSAGDFWEGKRRYVVRTLGQFDDLEDVEAVVVARREGRPVYVRDVATVELGHKKPTGIVRSFGETSIALNAVRETGANVIDVMDGLRAAVVELNEGHLHKRGLHLNQVYDETEYIDSAVGLVRQNIVVGGVLTVLVLLLFLRSARSTLVIGLAIPTSIIGTFLVLGILGRSLNVISLAGLSFAVGMLVDNAVVVLENVYRHHQEGKQPFRAAVDGTREVWGAVLASTLTTLAVFIPVVFVEEQAGQLFRDIALAISGAVGLSMIVSITVISTASARVLRRHEEPEAADGASDAEADEVPAPAPARRGVRLGFVDRFAGGFVAWIVGVNAWTQRGVLRQLAVILLFVGAAAAGTWALFPKVEYLPTGNRNLAIGIVLPPAGYNLDELTAMGLQVEDRLEPYWNVDADSAAARELDYPPIENFFYVARGRSVFLGVRADDPMRAGELIPMIQMATGGIPGTFAIAKQSSLFEQGLSAGRTIDVEITGPELERLVGLGGRLMGELAQAVPGAQLLPQPSLDLSNPEVHVLPKLDAAADVGIDTADLGYTVNALVDGAYASDYYLGGDKIDLSIVGREQYASRTQDLAALPIATPTGDLVPLGSIADIRLGSGPEQINRRERERAITIQVSPPETMALEDAMERITTQVIDPLRESGELGSLYRIELSGTADKLEQTWDALSFNILLALLITYLLMAALFESWTYPFVVILSVPLGAVGGFLGLRLLNLFVNQPLDVLTMLGFVILIGTVVNNAILIVHQSLELLRESDIEPADAILESVRTRVRPIFMTTTTTVFGLLPLVVSPGAGSELYRGLGSVVLGGLVVSTAFTLFLVPTLLNLAFRVLPSTVESARTKGQRRVE